MRQAASSSLFTAHLSDHELILSLIRLTCPSKSAYTPACHSTGYGITCVLEDGEVLEKAAANISVVRGILTAQRAQAMSSRGRSSIDSRGGQPYSAAAMSLVFHSAHPLIPTLRADVRLFQASGRLFDQTTLQSERQDVRLSPSVLLHR